MTCVYRVELINRDGQLDLRTKEQAIRGVIREVVDARPELLECEVVTIEQYGLTLSVEETGDWWHCQVGKKLANEWGMRHFCNPRNASQMFAWSRQPTTDAG